MLGNQLYRRLPHTKRLAPCPKVHVWTRENDPFCTCGKLHRDDPRLLQIIPGDALGEQICGSCG